MTAPNVMTLGVFPLWAGMASVVACRRRREIRPCAIRTLLKQYTYVDVSPIFAPKGLEQTSPGQRPGLMVSQFYPSPERAEQIVENCFALSGLRHFWGMFTQGVALGWFVDAPSARDQFLY